jgi:hypothetical protein
MSLQASLRTFAVGAALALFLNTMVGGIGLLHDAAATPSSPSFGAPGAPTMDIYGAPALPAYHDAGEPSIGVNWNTNAVMYQAFSNTYRVTFDDTTRPATPSWHDASAAILLNIDPILATDPVTGRTWAGGLISPCSDLQYTDNDGVSWSQVVNPCSGTNDHETIGSGPWANTPTHTAADYSRAVYYCAQSLTPLVGLSATVQDACATSHDGGRTFLNPVPVTGACNYLHGHIHVSADGTAYLPNANCGSKVGGGRSTNSGLTWDSFTIAASTRPAKGFDPSMASTPDNTVYEAWSGANHHPMVAKSTTHGDSWTGVTDLAATVSPPLVASTFQAAVAGDNGRVAVAYLGTSDGGSTLDPFSNGFHGVWYLYVSFTYDGGATWTTVKATPDPVQRGCIWDNGGSNPCRNLLDFMGASVDKNGRVVVGFADGCTGACALSSGTEAQSTDAYATIARQGTGRGLFASKDTSSGAPLLTVSSPADGATVPAGSVDVSGTVDRLATAPLAADAGGPYTAQTGSVLVIGGAYTGGSGSVTCAWSGAGASFGNAAACSTTVTYAATGTYTLSLTVTDSTSATATDTASVTVTAPGGPLCTTDPAGDAIVPVATPVDPFDLTQVCVARSGSNLVVTIQNAGSFVDGRLGAVMSPVLYTFSVNSHPEGWDIGTLLGVLTVVNNNGSPTAATASIANGVITVTIPVSEAGAATSFVTTTSAGESLRHTHVLQEIDRVPDSGSGPLGAPLGLLGSQSAPQVTDPAGDAGCVQPGTCIGPAFMDIRQVQVTAETATTFDVTMTVDSLASLPPNPDPTSKGPVDTIYELGFCTNNNAVTYTGGSYAGVAGVVCYRATATHGPVSDVFSAVSVQKDGSGCTLNALAPAGNAFNTAANTVTWRLAKAKLNLNAASIGNDGASCGSLPAGAGAALVPGTVLSRLQGTTGTFVGYHHGLLPGAFDGVTLATLGDATDPASATPFTFAIGTTAPPLVANAGGPYSGLTGDAIAISGSGSGGTAPLTCSWSGVGATFADGTACVTTVGFSTAQTATITLTVHDAASVTATSSATVVVSDPVVPGNEHVEVDIGTAHASVDVDSSTGPASWTTTLDLTGFADGAYTLTAKWFDADGSQIASTVTHTLNIGSGGSTGTSTGTTTTTSTTSSTSSSGTGGATTDSGTAGGSVNNVAPAVDSLSASPGIAVIGRDAEVALAGAAHDNNGNQDIAGVTVTVTDPLGAAATPAATVTNDAGDATAVSFAASSAVGPTTPTGTYQVDTFASDADGAQSPVVSLTFTVLPPPAVEVGYTDAASRLDFGSFDPGTANVESQNAFSLTNSLHEDKDFLFDMTDFTCTHGAVPVMGNAKVHLGHLDGAGDFVSDATLDYTQSTVDFGTISDGTSLFVKLELVHIPLAIAGTCTASFGLYHS